MNRRDLLTALAVGIVAAPPVVDAQSPRRPPVVAYVSSGAGGGNITVDAFDRGLRELGYAVGQNIVVEYRFGDGHVDRVPALVEDVIRRNVDVIFAANPYAIRETRKATSSIPIVGIDLETDPIHAGWIKSLARPGGNLTGFFLDIPELGGKQIQFLREVLPRLQRVGVLWDANLASAPFKATEDAARVTNVTLRSLAFRSPEDFGEAFEAARDEHTQALVVLSSPAVFGNLRRVAGLAHEYRFPAICSFPEFAEAGGLMGYGPNLSDLYRRAAGYVDRILKGARPADLPIQRPATFDFCINLRTAKALGLAIPSPVLARATQVIQ